MKRKTKLDKKAETIKPPFVMAHPNDDADAYGWTLGKLCHLATEADDKDWPGLAMFDMPLPFETRQIYGHNVEFACPGFVQMLLDADPRIRAGALKVRAAKYSTESIKKYQKTVCAVFADVVMPEIEKRFNAIAANVAEFYAARLAHIDTFGVDE